MGKIFDAVRQHVAAGRYLVSEHAVDRLLERSLLEWQVVEGLAHGKLIAERGRTKPHPSVEVAQSLADGTEVRTVWSLLPASKRAKLVTVFFLDR